ncbi:hypothetical protein HELRODRAFT_70062, partial [Helobdella robusta]|uniref:Heme-copper oxidase subunit III family profile domain-containing protein n=1 Tax=Helobdella robusta TaxID=6412 RepID=T1G020_HELRO
RDVTREATLIGNHTSYVVNGLRIGMLLFICNPSQPNYKLHFDLTCDLIKISGILS